MSADVYVLFSPFGGNLDYDLSQRSELLRELQVARRFFGKDIEMRHGLLIVGSKNGNEHHLQDHKADVVGDVDALFLCSRLLPSFEQRDVGCCDDVRQRPNGVAMERRLDHPPLPFPELTFAHHKAVTKQQGNTFDGLAFCVVLPILAKDVLCILGAVDRIYVSAVDRGFVDVPVLLEMIAHPTQEVLSCIVFLDRSWWNSPTFGGHIS